MSVFPLDLKTGIGKTGVAVATVVAFAMCLLSYIFQPVEIVPIQYGICLPSPDTWEFDHFWSWVINTGLIGLTTILLFLINKSYNFIRTTEPTLMALFMIMASSGPWFTETITTSVLLCLANVVCMGIIFDSYDSRNSTQEMFILGAVVGFGSMVQYAFLPMGIVYLIWALFMRVLRIKETLAFILGIACPYWIVLGTGWIRLADLHYPSLNPLFMMTQDPSEFFILLSGVALAAGAGFVVALVNSFKLYAGNSRVNAMNLCVSTLGAFSVICILIDFDNMHAYVTTLYMATAAQIANICALWNPKMPWTVTLLPALCYIGIFVCSIIF